MGAMTVTEPTGLPRGPLTVADLEDFPDDGRRYELLDGLLIVSPAPRLLHQYAAYRLGLVLEAVVPAGMLVFPLPLSVRPQWWLPPGEQTTELQPDVLVVRRDGVTPDQLQSLPLLVVEVLSRSTRLYDLNTKKAAYARIGIPDYWVVDPRAVELTAFTLDGDEYRLVGRAGGDDAFAATTPFPVTVVPRTLVDLDPRG